jgi:fructokinase
MARVACVEIGGTSSAVAIADTLGSFLWKQRGIPTAAPLDPSAVVANICAALKSSGYSFSVIGIASFGPLDLANGRIAMTPKPGWAKFPLVAEFRRHCPGATVILETDVIAPAYSEFLAISTKAPGPHAVGYLTVGTGVGLGVFADGHSYHGMLHPEFGHLLIARRAGDTFAGTCPFHGGGCVEGLLSSAAIAGRCGVAPADLPSISNEDPAWDLFAYYLGVVAANAALAYALDYLVVGGGIMTADGREFLYEKANEYCKAILAGYVDAPIIRPPEYRKDSGLVGAAAFALHSEVFAH